MAILDLGAYGFTESMPYFLSHPVAAEIPIRSGRAATIRPRVKPADSLRLQDIALDVAAASTVGRAELETA